MNIHSTLAVVLTTLVLPVPAAAVTPVPSASGVPNPSPSMTAPSTAPNPSPTPVLVGDVAASGASVEAHTGQRVTVRVGMSNVGNGALQILMHGAEGYWMLYFYPPPGTEVTRGDPGCTDLNPPPYYVAVVDAPYACFVDRVIPPAEDDHVFPPGLSYTFSFDLKVTGGAGRTTGWVRAAVSNARLDSNPTNDTALVVVTVTGPGTASSSGVGLPITGPPVLGLATAGALLIAAGVTIVVLTRRRAHRAT